MKTKLILVLLVSLLSFSIEAKPKKAKKITAPVLVFSTPAPSDMDWVWENGSYIAFWVNEDENGFAWIVGPEFPDGIRVMKDSLDGVTFKNHLMFLVDTLGGS